VRDLTAAFPNDWTDHVGTFFAAEHRYYVLIWRERYEEARAYADRMAEEMRRIAVPPGSWLERRGDALLWMGDPQGARQSYEESLAARVDKDPVFAKLSDVYFALGDLDRERLYREKVYGSLRR
jgi:tetratricopeptide (TPR) repeat protein